MTQTSVKQNCDPKAVAVAEAVYDAVHPVAVILFGSRARGDHREESDIDLLVITDDTDEEVDWRPGYVDLCQAAHRSVEEVYGFFLNVDVVTFPKTQFQYYRRAKNHVTGQAMRDGVIVTGNPQDFPGDLSGEPSNWPDIRVRFIAATRNIRSMSDLVAANSPREDIGFHAQQAIENALKAWISALDDEYHNTHDIASLADIVRRHPAEIDTPAGESLYWLTKYAVEYRYEGARVRLHDPPGLLQTIRELTDAIAARILQLTGSEPPRWTPPPEE